MADGLNIDPEEIPDYLTGNGEAMPDFEVEIACDGVMVCRYVDGKLDAIACDHPRHGCHPGLRERYARVHELMDKLKAATASRISGGPCPKCADTGWLEVTSPEARHVVLLSTMIGMWRGISFPPRGLSAGSLDVTMGLLTGSKPDGASSSPARVTAPDRALFYEIGQGKEKGDDHEPE